MAVALADDVLTDSELRDLERVASLLAIESQVLGRLIAAATPAVRHGRSRNGSEHEFVGLSVCFTGACECCVNGCRLTREEAELLAAKAGLLVAPRVTKALNLLVVADPDTMSGKAAKARQFGTRIIAERAFWPAIGVHID